MRRSDTGPACLRALTLLTITATACLAGTTAPPLSRAELESRLGSPPGSYRVTAPDGKIQIPFELYRDDIRMVAEVNGQPLHMLIDNGYLWDQLLFFGSPCIDSLDLHYDGEIAVGGSGSGDPVMSRTASGITITFPGVEFFDQTAVVTPYESGLTNLWEGADGQVSAAFLKHFVVAMNFDTMTMTLTPPEQFEYRGQGMELPLTPKGGGAWAIPATVVLADGRRLEVDLSMDLGDGNPLSIATGGPNDIRPPEPAIQTRLGFGVQGPIFGHFGRVRSVELGGYRLDDVLATFASGDDSGYAEAEFVVGMGIFQRFNLVFDYPGGRLFVEPNLRFAEPFRFNCSGLELAEDEDGNFVVAKVYPGSPGEESGLRQGDRITEIDGVPAGDLRSWDLRPLLRQEGRTVRLALQRDGNRRQVEIVLRRLL